MQRVKAARHAVWMAYVGVHRPTRSRRPPRRAPSPEKKESARSSTVHLGVDGGGGKQGGMVGLQFGIDGKRWGLSTRLTSLSFSADGDGTYDNHLQLAAAHLTLAPLSGERGRLRLEAGVATAREPGVATFVGPSFGLSFERCLFGALDVEGRGQWVPLPHLQLEAQLGLGLHLGVLTLRAGWRGMHLDDRGRADGVRHQAKAWGPFAGVGLDF